MERSSRALQITIALVFGFLTLAVPTGAQPGYSESAALRSEAELRAVVQSIAVDAMTANIEGLQSIHLDSEKFSKFGPRSFERQDLSSTNRSEAAFFSSVADMKYEANDLKIDVFDDVGIVTYYPHVTFTKDGEPKEVHGRQTLVFLKTPDGWKIVHEHGTIRP
jgi:hypothetical protein